MPRLTPAFIASTLAHLLVLALALFAWPQQDNPEIRLGAVPVSVVSDVVREAAPSPTPAEQPSDEPEAETPNPVETPEPPAPQPQPTPTPPTPPRQPQRPPQRPPERPTQQPQRPPERPTQQPQRPPSQPQRPPSQPQRPPATTEAPLDLDSIAGGSGRQSDRTQPGRQPAGESGRGDAPAATGPQVAAIGGQIVPHWNLSFCDLPGGNSLTIRMRVTLGADGRITAGPTLVRQEASSVYRAASENAIRAARSAAPYDVPDGFRAQELNFTFDTAGACRNR